MEIGPLSFSSPPLVLAPMEDVSDPPFRKVCKENGADLLFTEFVSSEGLIRGAVKSKKKLDVFAYEKPVGVQIFGNDETSMKQAAELVFETSADIIDINFGCPVKKIVNKGCGAAILKDVEKMASLTRAIVEISPIPVTVKTRLGWDSESIQIEEVVMRLQDVGVSAMSIHARTRAQMYKGEADWSWFEKIKRSNSIHIPIIGNGDVSSPEIAAKKIREGIVDGVMIGRAAIGNPWFFSQTKQLLSRKEKQEPSLEERVATCRQHLLHSVEWKGEKLGLLEMRRHYSKYFKNFPHFKKTKERLLTQTVLEEIKETLQSIELVELN